MNLKQQLHKDFMAAAMTNFNSIWPNVKEARTIAEVADAIAFEAVKVFLARFPELDEGEKKTPMLDEMAERINSNPHLGNK